MTCTFIVACKKKLYEVQRMTYLNVVRSMPICTIHPCVASFFSPSKSVIITFHHNNPFRTSEGKHHPPIHWDYQNCWNARRNKHDRDLSTAASIAGKSQLA